MIENIKGSWQEVVDACRATVGKPPLGREPSMEFKKKLLISEHSPIRRLIVSWRWALPSWVATHFSRHKWECFIRTQRTDRTGVDRNQLPQGTLVEFLGEANAQHLIDTSRNCPTSWCPTASTAAAAPRTAPAASSTGSWNSILTWIFWTSANAMRRITGCSTRRGRIVDNIPELPLGDLEKQFLAKITGRNGGTVNA